MRTLFHDLLKGKAFKAGLALFIVTGAACAAGPVSDDFHTGTLNGSLWTLVNPVGDGSYQLTGSNLLLTAPAGANHDPQFGGSDNAVRLMQAITNVDFQVEAKFDSIPAHFYQSEGMIVEQDAQNYLRFDLASDGTKTYLAATKIVNSAATTLLTSPITISGSSVWMRVQKSGSTWTVTWSADGSIYNTGTTFTQTLTVARVGPYAGNYNSPSTAAPAFSASIDYVFNTASPVSPEDGGGPNLSQVSAATSATAATLTWSTDVAATSRADYGPTTSYGQNVGSAALVTGHSVTITGLTCSTTYDFQVTSAVTGGSTVSPNGTFSTAGCGASGPLSDDFRNSTLNTGLWTFVDPFGGSYLLTGTNLVLTVPGGYIHDPVQQGPNESVRMMQSTANTNFGVEIKFDTIPVQALTEQGILVQQDGSNFLRFEFQGVGSGTNLFASAVIGGSQTTFYNQAVSVPGPSVWMRVSRSGNVWTLSWSANGSTYQTATTFTQAITVSLIGPMVGNFQSPVGASPDFAASIDYFFNTAAPIVPEDGGEPQISSVSSTPGAASAAITWNTDEAATSRVDYGTTLSYGGTATSAALVTSHSILVSGLSCSTAYDYAVTSVDGTNNSKQTGNLSFVTPPCSGAAAPVSDGFDTSSLNTSVWTWVDPVQDSYIAFNGTTAQITVPYGSVHDPWASKGNRSARIMQPIANINFDVVAKFNSELDWPTTAQGILVEQDALHYIRFEFQSNGSTTSVFAGTRNGNIETAVINAPIHAFPSLWLRVTRSGNNWTVSWSVDGNTYTQAGGFTQTLVSASIGLYAANYGNTLKLTAALTASVDFFMNTAAPVTNVVAPIPFARIVIDQTPGAALVEKTIADLDGDGRPDVIVGLESPNQGYVLVSVAAHQCRNGWVEQVCHCSHGTVLRGRDRI